MTLNPGIFREYDIRGIVPNDLDEKGAEVVGEAFGNYVKEIYGKHIVVGHDNRITSVSLKEGFVAGLLSAGCDVVDTGLSLTPVIQFLTYDPRFDAGVIVTASHNPKEFNGFRFAGKNANPIFGDSLKKIGEIATSGSHRSSKGTLTYEDLFTYYSENLLKKFQFTGGIKIVSDCGNGTTSNFVTDLFRDLLIVNSSLFCDLDGSYPHGIPDPENPLFMSELSKAVLETGAQLGVAFDTDGDRFGVVDEKGRYYSNDKLLMLFASEALKKLGTGKIIFDVKSTESLFDVIREYGGEPVMIRTGHPYFINIIKQGALMGAEFSGHTFFGDRYLGFDDGIYSFLRVLEIMEHTGKRLSELMAEFPKTYSTYEVKIPISDESKFQVVKSVAKKLEEAGNIEKIIETDGIRVYLASKTWFLLRASNTSPYLSVRFESDTSRGLSEAVTLLSSYLPGFKPESALPIHFS